MHRRAVQATYTTATPVAVPPPQSGNHPAQQLPTPPHPTTTPSSVLRPPRRGASATRGPSIPPLAEPHGRGPAVWSTCTCRRPESWSARRPGKQKSILILFAGGTRRRGGGPGRRRGQLLPRQCRQGPRGAHGTASWRAPRVSGRNLRVGFAAPPRAGSLFKRPPPWLGATVDDNRRGNKHSSSLFASPLPLPLARSPLPAHDPLPLAMSPPSSSEEEASRGKPSSASAMAPGRSGSASAAARGKSGSAGARAPGKSGPAGAVASGKSVWAEMGVAPFQDGQYVRLRNRGRGGYLCADETGRGVSIDPRRGMVNTAWVAQVLETDTNYFVLLRGAYGRHLAVTRDEAGPGHVGFDAAQCAFDEPEDSHVMWWTTPGKKGSVVLLHGTSARLSALRANGRFRRWHRRVTVEAINRSRVTSMMEWEVQVIPMRVERPPYQLRPGGPDIPWHQGSEEIVQVNCVVADDNGSTDGQGREALTLHGRSLMGLGDELAQRLGDGLNFQDITLCIQAGNLAQPTVLLTDLPHRDDPVDIVVFRVGTPGHDRLLFPDLDAE
ncbi:hypothetical protein ACQJBY_037358 [Aegilops geniculata]